jgi:hypothetical protein
MDAMTEANHVVDKGGNLEVGKVDEVLNRMDGKGRDEILQDFEMFRSYLAKRVHMAQMLGMNEEQLAVTAQKIADFLSEHEEPRNAEENLLKKLWKVGRDEEKHMLAHMLVRLAQNIQS